MGNYHKRALSILLCLFILNISALTVLAYTQSSVVTYTGEINYIVTVPSSIQLNTERKGDYNINVKGDIGTTQCVKVVPAATFNMKQVGKSDVVATASQAKIEFTAEELAVKDEDVNIGTSTTGNIAAEVMSAGNWSGELLFTIGVIDNTAGLYTNDNNFVAWQTLEDQGYVSVVDGVLTTTDEFKALFAEESSIYAKSTIELPSKVTEIGDYAFDSYIYLSGVTMTNNVTTVGVSAFQENYHLNKGVVFSNNLTTIKDQAFWWSDEWPSDIVLPDSVTTIGEKAFGVSDSYQTGYEITIPSTVTTISENAFYNVKNVIYNGDLDTKTFGALAINGISTAEVSDNDNTI
jgi:hypothetical protein